MQDPNQTPQEQYPAQQPGQPLNPPQPPAAQPPQYQPQQVAPQLPETPAAANPFFAEQPGQPTGAPGTTPVAPATPPKKPKLPLILIIVIAAVVLIGGGIGAFLILNNSAPQGVSSSQAGESDAEIAKRPDQKEEITAANIVDFKALCENKKVSNAADAIKPYKLLPFLKSNDGWAIYALNDSRLSTELTEINAVGCVALDTSTEQLVKSNCEATNVETQEKVTVDTYSASYKITFYEAETGKVIGTETVTPADKECPQYAATAGKYHYVPTDADMKSALDAFLN